MGQIATFIAAEWGKRRWWMNLTFLFCLYMTFIYLPFDLFLKPVADDEEVWLGFTLHGWWAKATEPLHWLIYAAGAYGFWKMKHWMWPWAAAYVGQVALAMLLWNVIDPRGAGGSQEAWRASCSSFPRSHYCGPAPRSNPNSNRIRTPTLAIGLGHPP